MKKRTATHVERALPELLEDGLITQEQVEPLRAYCAKQKDGANRTFIYPLIGAVVTALGIMLLVANNWDELSPTVRILLSMGGLAFGQALCLYTLLKRPDSVVWRESTAIFATLMIAIPLAVIGQVYNLSQHFALTWVLLSLPMMYLMRSVGAAVVSMSIIVLYMIMDARQENVLILLGLVAAVVPAWWLFTRRQRHGTGASIYGWALCGLLSILFVWVCVEMINDANTAYSFSLAYYSILFSIGLLINPGHLPLLRRPFWFTGWAALATTILPVSIRPLHWSVDASLATTWPEGFWGIYALAAVLAICAIWKKREWNVFPLVALPYGLAIHCVLYMRGILGMLLASIIILVMSLIEIRAGRRMGKIWETLMGILLLAALALGHFFFSDFTPLAKGIIFIGIGLLFLVVRPRRKPVPDKIGDKIGDNIGDNIGDETGNEEVQS